MKIGFGTTFLEKGLAKEHMDGIGVYSKNLWEKFEGVEKQAISFGNQEPNPQTVKLLGDIKYLPLSYPLQSALSLLSSSSFLGSNKLEKEMDLFFAPDHHIPKFDHIPVIATIMDAYPLIYPKLVSQRLRKFKNIAFKRTSKWADHIITISEHSKQDIIHYFDIPAKDISVIPLGVNRAFFQKIPDDKREAVRQKFGLKEDYFIFVGTIQPRKNLSRLIEAYLSLPSTLRQKHPLVIIGHYGWGEDDLKHKLDTLGKSDTIHHLTHVSDQELYALLQSALAMVYPSLYEGFGLPILEGFASQIPVITSSTTSIPEVAGDAACYVDPLDSSDIATKMKQLVNDKMMREEMIKKGLKKVETFSWEQCAEEHLKLFAKIINSR